MVKTTYLVRTRLKLGFSRPFDILASKRCKKERGENLCRSAYEASSPCPIVSRLDYADGEIKRWELGNDVTGNLKRQESPECCCWLVMVMLIIESSAVSNGKYM